MPTRAELIANLTERYQCPYRADGTMLPTRETHTDTSGTLVRVWECAQCGYTEAHADPASPSNAFTQFVTAFGGA